MRFPARFPLRFGGPDRTLDQEHQALLDALAPGWDTDVDTEFWVETRADAFAVSLIWAINRRVGNQAFPLRMLDDLESWESATGLRPTPVDPLPERRAVLAAKLRGVANNAINDIESACETALGINYEALVQVDADDWISYWPGVNPGPPGYEFSSNRAHVCIHCNKVQLNEAQFRAKRANLIEILTHMLPAWMTFTIGVGSGAGTTHVCNVGIVGQTII